MKNSTNFGSHEVVEEHDLGHWVTVVLEKSETPRLLPQRSLFSLNKMGEIVVEDLNQTNRYV